MADYEANFTLEPQPTIEADFSINISNGDHNQLTNRDKADQHPISAITGLQDVLDTIPTDYVSDDELEAALLEKQDVIRDLSEIRQGATLGATAVQPNELESYATTDYVDDGLSGKQDTLTAGANIQIVGNTISATDTTYTAGTGISIVGNVISNTQTSAEWGNITGTLSAQTDLQNALNLKANTADIPTATSDLTNDSGFITSAALTPYATQNYVNTELSNKQDKLTQTQLDAVNSGANTTNIGQIATNTSDIADINALIPNQASSSNQLADKDFVNSSIATNTATFRGTYNSVAELNAYSGEKDNNDYAFVTGEDSLGNTYYDNYVYNGTAWAYRWRLNNSSFTAAQWASINSNATSEKIAKISTNETAINNHIANKNNPHEVTKAQIGLGNVDNTSDLNKPISTATQTALNLKADASDLTSHITNTSNPHDVTKAQVGLGNVDNTSDLNKPISTATQTALDNKQDKLTSENAGTDIEITDTVDVETEETVTGVNTITLESAKADSLTSVTLSGKCRQSNLPEGFTQVEYLGVATSNVYFPTGINATIDTDMGITASNITSSSAQILVAQCVSGSDYFRIAKAGVSQRIIGSFGSSSVTDNNTTGETKFTARMNKSGFYVNGSLVGTFSNPPSSFTDIGEVDIFRGKYSETTYYAYVGSRFYSAWIDDNIFLPCRRNSDNQLGIYNTKTSQFILPSGTGTFIAGPDVTVPTPDTPIDIVCNNGVVKVSRNLFDKTAVIRDKSIDIDGVEVSNIGYSISDYISVIPGQTCIRSLNGVAYGNTYFTYDKNKTFIATYQPGSGIPFTIASGVSYIRFNIASANLDIYQLEQGSTATQYRPYGQIYTDGTIETVTDSVGNTANAEMLLAVDNYKDTQEVLNGSVNRQLGIYVLDGTEKWAKSSTYTGSFYTSDATPPDGAKVANNPNVYCTHGFKVNNLSEYSSATIGAIYWYAAQTINYKYDDGTATVEQFKQFLAEQYANGTPVIVVYPLATATTESVTSQSLSVQAGTNTIAITQASVDTLGLTAEYTKIIQGEGLKISFANDSGYATENYVTTAVSGKQDTLVSGTNIKTINNTSLLGSGNIDIQGGGSSYTAGTGIDITNDVISVDNTIALKSEIPTNNNQLTNGAGYITGITSSDVTTALGYTPYNSSNPNGYTSNVGTVTSVNNISPVNGNVTLSIPAAQVNSDWNATSGVAQILNKPTLGTMAAESASDYTTTANLATVATSGSYTDLSNKPDLTVYQTTANLVTSVSSSSTNSQYPSAKLFYDTCGDIETLINTIRGV